MPSRSTRGKPRGKRIAAIATIVAYIFIVIPYAFGFPGAYAVVDRAAVLASSCDDAGRCDGDALVNRHCHGCLSIIVGDAPRLDLRAPEKPNNRLYAARDAHQNPGVDTPPPRLNRTQ